MTNQPDPTAGNPELYAEDVPRLRVEVAALRMLLKGKEGLLAAYRAGRPPSQMTWKTLEKAERALAALDQEESNG